MNQFQLLEAIKKYLAVIWREQLPDGGFLHQSWLAGEGIALGAVEYKTTFFAANILSCLNSIVESMPSLAENFSELPDIIKIRENAARFLLAQKSEYWTFNYWTRESREAEAMPYPDDLDDTFVALAALHGYDSSLIEGTTFACIAKMLMAVEVEPGGPYRTWLMQSNSANQLEGIVRAAWRDVDLVVNSNVGYFLSGVGISLPNLDRFIDEQIEKGDLHSPYYPGVIQAIYFISRFYQGKQKMMLADILLCEQPQTILERAMSVSTFINLGFPEKISENDLSIITQIIESADADVLAAFCIDPSRERQICHAGSVALTAVFCAEALVKYLHLCSAVCPIPPTSNFLLLKIKTIAYAKCDRLPGILKERVFQEIEQMTDENIVMVPYVMYQAIGQPKSISPHLLDELALANLYGWIAYTIYDDFLDGEGDVLLLSAANFFLRELSLQYAKLDEKIPGICDEYEKIMNMLDAANVWEQLHCRAVVHNGVFIAPRNLPYRSRRDLETLADRSLGHALPALGVLFAAGYGPDSPELVAARSFFKNDLIARQLHDDAHDWKQDLLRGQINSVGSRLFGMSRESDEPLAELILELQKLFWREAISDVVTDITFFIDSARAALAPFKNPAPFLELLDHLQSAADETLRERNRAIQFIAAYH